MNLKIGNRYKTRDGRIATVTYCINEYSYRGILDDGVFCSWTENGRYVSDDEENIKDLVEDM